MHLYPFLQPPINMQDIAQYAVMGLGCNVLRLK